jgi:hypothetical protein
MMNITELTTSQLNSIIAIKEEIERLQSQIESIVSGQNKIVRVAAKPGRKGKRRLSLAGRAAIIAGTKARWAKWAKASGASDAPKAAKKKDRRSSPAVRAKLAAAAKARWAKVKAQGKTTL